MSLSETILAACIGGAVLLVAAAGTAVAVATAVGIDRGVIKNFKWVVEIKVGSAALKVGALAIQGGSIHIECEAILIDPETGKDLTKEEFQNLVMKGEIQSNKLDERMETCIENVLQNHILRYANIQTFKLFHLLQKDGDLYKFTRLLSLKV